MKAKAARVGKGWLDRKLASQKFRKGFEEEVQKLAIGEQLSRLRQEAGLTQAQVAASEDDGLCHQPLRKRGVRSLRTPNASEDRPRLRRATRYYPGAGAENSPGCLAGC